MSATFDASYLQNRRDDYSCSAIRKRQLVSAVKMPAPIPVHNDVCGVLTFLIIGGTTEDSCINANLALDPCT